MKGTVANINPDFQNNVQSRVTSRTRLWQYSATNAGAANGTRVQAEVTIPADAMMAAIEKGSVARLLQTDDAFELVH